MGQSLRNSQHYEAMRLVILGACSLKTVKERKEHIGKLIEELVDEVPEQCNDGYHVVAFGEHVCTYCDALVAFPDDPMIRRCA
jgi:hypothetical protein